MTLRAKLLISAAAAVGVIAASSVVAVVQLQRSAGLHQTRLAAQTLASSIYHGLEVSMVRNNPDEIREIIKSLQKQPMVRRVDVLGADGRVWASTGGERAAGVEPSAFRAAVASGEPVVRELAGTDELLALQPIVNRPDCQPCHEGHEPILGVVAVALDTTPLSRQVARSTRVMEALMALTALASVAMLSLPLSRVVLRPVRALSAGVARLARGDYSVRIRWSGRDELGLLASAFNDMAERVERYTAGLNREIAGLTSRLVGLSLLGRTLTEVEAADFALDEVVEAVGRLVGANGCGLFLHDGRVRTWGSGDLVRQAAERTGEGGPPNSLVVPLAIKDQDRGRLVVVRAEGRGFGGDDRAVVESVGHLVAIALENMRLFREVREKEQVRGQLLTRAMVAQEEERRRVARELHDEVGQSLTALMLRIDLLLQALDRPGGDRGPGREGGPRGPNGGYGLDGQQTPQAEAVRQALASLRQLTESTLGEVRRMIYDLRPSALDELDLASALRGYARAHLEPAGVSVAVHTAGLEGRRFPQVLETTLFRVAQEALTNVLRHARARRVEIRLERVSPARPGEPDELRLVVQDDGQGFDLPCVMGRRDPPPLGLMGMQERIELTGGRLTIDSSPGRGTRVEARIPLVA